MELMKQQKKIREIFEAEKDDDKIAELNILSSFDDMPYKEVTLEVNNQLQSLKSSNFDELLSQSPQETKILAVQNNCLEKLGNVTSKIIKQFLVLGETLFNQPKFDVVEVANFVKVLCEYFEQEINTISNQVSAQM